MSRNKNASDNSSGWNFLKIYIKKTLDCEVHSLTVLPHHSALNSLIKKKPTVMEYVIPKILSICFVKIPLISL